VPEELREIHDEARFRPKYWLFLSAVLLGAAGFALVLHQIYREAHYGWMAGILLGLQLLPVLLALRNIRLPKQAIREIQIDDRGFLGTTFGEDVVNIGWNEVTEIRFATPTGRLHKAKRIDIITPHRSIRLDRKFRKLKGMAKMVEHMSHDRGFDAIQRVPGYEDVDVVLSRGGGCA
jgi:hypothetical protein